MSDSEHPSSESSEESSSEEFSDDDSEESNEVSDFDDEPDEGRYTGRDLLWLCQEGLIEIALDRVRRWRREFEEPPSEDGTAEEERRRHVRRELFLTSGDGDSPLHEILMGGCADGPSAELAKLVSNLCAEIDPPATSALLASRPKSHGRTALHWAAWGKAPADLIQSLSMYHPEALFARDDAPHGRRTPLEIAERYWPSSDATAALRSLTDAHGKRRVRIEAHLCARRFFRGTDLVPMDKDGRKSAGVAPRPWFAVSVLGYFLQHEATGLALKVLSFLPVGVGKRKIGGRDGKRKRRAKAG